MPNNDIQGMLDKAASLLGQQRYEEALRAYHEIVEAAPNCGEAWLRLGSINHRHGNLPRAEVCYRAAIKIDHNDGNAMSGWGAVLPAMQRPKESDELLTQLVACPPDNSEACCSLAILCSTLGRYADALDSIDRAMILTPQVAKYVFIRADILSRRGDFEEAFDILKPYLEAKNPRPGAILVFSNFSHVVGLKEECIKLLERVRDRRSLTPSLRFEVAKAMDRVRNANLT